MSVTEIQPPFPLFTDVDGQPLNGGLLYVGVANLEPITNPISVFWDDALSIPALQPIMTINGYPSRAGTPSRIFCDSDFSMTVKDIKGTLVFSSPSVAGTENNLRNDLASAVTGKGAALVNDLAPYPGAVARDQHKRNLDVLWLSEFVTDFTGATDQTAQVTAAVTAALLNRRKLKCPTGKVLINNVTITNAMADKWPHLEIEGEIGATGEALAQSAGPGTVFITNGANAFTVSLDKFEHESIRFKNVGFQNIGAMGTTDAVRIEKVVTLTGYPRGIYFEECGQTGFGSLAHFVGLDPSIFNSFFGTTVFDRCISYLAGAHIRVTDAFVNLIQIDNCLFHGGTVGGLVFDGAVTEGGGVLAISSTHFEACEPAAIVGAHRNLAISLHNVSSESCGVTSTLGFFSLPTPASPITVFTIRITGNASLPGTTEPIPTLPAGATISSTTPITIRSKGCLVLTPDMVSLDGGTDYSFAYYPAEKNSNPSRREPLFPYNGTTIGNIAVFNAVIPRSLLNQYQFCNPNINDGLYDQRATFGVVAAPRKCVVTFLGRATTTEGFFPGNALYTLNGVTTNIVTATINALKVDLVCQLVIPIPTGQDLTRLTLIPQTMDYSTPAYVSMETGQKSMSAWGQPPNREIEYSVTIAPAGNFVFSEMGIIANPYSILATLILDVGQFGTINYAFYGITTNGSKYRDVISGASKSASVVVTTADGAHTDFYNVTVQNNFGVAIQATLRVKYQN